MKMIQPHAGFNGKRGHRAFTLIEIMISLLILGILLALIIGGAKLAIRTAKGTVDHQAVHSINMGASQFKQLFGFYIPLIRDEDQNSPNPRRTIVQISGINRVNVHRATDGLPGVPYLTFMQGPGPGVTLTNPLVDDRYSECSIPVYLAGQLSLRLDPAQPNGIPIDGIEGAGFCKPVIDGTFAIPSDILHPGTGPNTTKRTGTTYEPLISLGSSAPKLLVDPDHMPGDPGFNPEKVQVVDRNNVPIRYYRWEHGSQTPPPAGSPPFLNVPLMVGRWPSGLEAVPALAGFTIPTDRDLSKNANIRGAVYAIVAAGPDGVFGDEPSLDYICQKLGITLDTTAEVKIRMQAEQDNIVEVGQ
jgi:prepilin-type N-terminal cleavage/methylation domain-containing protein